MRTCQLMRYLANSLLFGDKTESELLDSAIGSAFVFSHLNAALTLVHFDTFERIRFGKAKLSAKTFSDITFGLKSLIAL